MLGCLTRAASLVSVPCHGGYMKRAVILMIACMFVWNQATPASESPVIDAHSGHAMPAGGSMLPTRDTARDVLNSSGRHPDWVRIPSAAGEILAWATYPDGADKAPVLIISENGTPLCDLMRAVPDKASQEGFITLVPERVDNAVRDFALRMAPANGKIRSMTFDSARIDLGNAKFPISQQGWTDAINLLNTEMDN